MNLHNLQARLIDQALPLGLGALDSPKGGHHGDVQIGGLPGNIHIRQNDFVNDDARVRAQGGDGGLEDLDGIGFGPVVEDVAEVIEFGALDGLGLEEVVFLEFDSCDGLCSSQGGWDVLHHDSAGQLREFALEGNGLLTEAASHIDQDGLLGRGEGAYFFFDGVRINPIVATLQSHEMAQTLHLVGVL